MLNSLLRIIVLLPFILVSTVMAQSNQAPWVGEDFNGFTCSGEGMNYGPFDYANAENRRSKLPIVESYHFTKEVQTLQKGKSGWLIDDIAYTLRAFPNHYKALDALAHYQLIFQNEINKNNKRPVNPAIECYFQRAINFVPKDSTVRVLFATYLKKIRKYQLAEQYYEQAIELDPKNVIFRYNYGLFLVKQKKLDQAKQQADIIYATNFPQQKLKQQLIKAGVWK